MALVPFSCAAAAEHEQPAPAYPSIAHDSTPRCVCMRYARFFPLENQRDCFTASFAISLLASCSVAGRLIGALV